MPGKFQTRRAARAAAAIAALSAAALIVPPLVLAKRTNTTATSAVEAASRDSFVLSAPMTISSEPRVVVASGTVSVLREASATGIGGTLLQYITGRRAALALDAAEIDVDLASASSTDGAASSGTFAAGSDVLAALTSALSRLEFRSLSLKDVTVRAHMESGRLEHIVVQSAEFEMQKSGDRLISGTLLYRGEPVTFDVAVGARPAAGATASTEAPVPVRATVKSRHLDGHFDGRFANSDRAYISATSATLSVYNLRQTARWLGESWPDGQGLGGFSARGGLLIDGRSVEFQNAKFMLDGNSASGTLAMRFSGERPSIEGTLAFEAFNIGPYTAAKKQTPIAVVADWLSDLRLPGTPKPSLITEIDSDLRLSAKSIVSNAQLLGRTAASLNIKDGVLSAELAELELEQGGSGNGEFTLDMRTSEPHFTLRGALRNVDFERALDNRLIAAPLSGQGNVSIDLSGTGAHEEDLLSSLAGKVSIEMPDGGSLGLDVAALPAIASSAVATTTPQPPWTRLGENATKLDRFFATFSGRDGVFTADAFEASSGETIIMALGSVGLADRTLDVTLKVAPASTSDTALTTGSIAAAAGEAPETATGSGLLASPAGTAYRLRGPWGSPAVNALPGPGKSAEPAVPVPYSAASKSRG